MVIRDPSAEKFLARLGHDGAKDLESRLGSPVRRFAASIIDHSILLWPFISLIVSPILRSTKQYLLVGDEGGSEAAMILAWLLGACFVLLYQAFFLSFYGATPGKKIMGLKVVRIWDGEERPSFMAALGRSLFWMGSCLFLGFPFLAILSDSRRRSFHDRAVDTIVVSSRRSLACAPPGLRDIVVVRSLIWCFTFALLTGAFSVGYYEWKHLEKTPIDAFGLKQKNQCKAVGEAYEAWPLENGETASRLSVAMSLFAAGQLDRECLEVEARNPFLSEDESSLAYLAKSFVHSDNQELSDLYLEQVCSDNRKSDDCVVAEVIEAMSADDFQTVDKKFSQLSQDGRVYSKIWALRQYIREERFEDANEFIDGMPDNKWLADFSVPARIKVLWGLKKREESRAAASTAFDALGKEEKLDLASWMCFEETADSCDQNQAKSCAIFSRYLQNDPALLTDFDSAMTQLKIAQCDEGDGVKQLLTQDINVDVKELATGVVEANENALRDILLRTDAREEIREEAALQLVDIAKKPEDVELVQKMWGEREGGLNWERVGLKLFGMWQSKKDWIKAVNVGERLLTSLRDSDTEFVHDYVVSLYRAGMRTEAFQMIADLDGKNDAENRTPASDNDSDYDEVLRAMQAGAGEK